MVWSFFEVLWSCACLVSFWPSRKRVQISRCQMSEASFAGFQSVVFQDGLYPMAEKRNLLTQHQTSRAVLDMTQGRKPVLNV
ncbi:hypothetical protein IWZ00DRAFT_49573 [Phyllosticta capitalensis]